MCGICGVWDPDRSRADSAAALTAMTSALSHRGPDDHGTWFFADDNVAFGHRRLSIIDLSCEGHQPMASHDGRYTMVYNGEFYNYREIKTELTTLGHHFRGGSDTEVMLAACVEWGVERALQRMAGMFALAIWDKVSARLYLARDRMGEKPLYYGWSNGLLLFGSELKALRAHPAWNGSIDRDALALMLRYSYVPTPFSIYQGIRKLLPGSVMVFDHQHRNGHESIYWRVADFISASPRRRHASDDEAASDLESILRTVISQQMISDVPLGAFLSGGIDSSTVVGIMQSVSSQPVRTFTIGFEENGFNEAVYAKAVAEHLGTDHTELYLTPEETLSTIPAIPSMYDEPFADSSQIPTYLVAKLARSQVTVSLSGDGGDELFGGYPRYTLAGSMWRSLRLLPVPLRRAVGQALIKAAPETWDALLSRLAFALPPSIRGAVTGDRVHKLSRHLRAPTQDELYVGLVSQWQTPGDIVVDGREPATRLTSDLSGRNEWDQLVRLMYLDMISYLPDDIMVKVDRATMAVSLESRAPFLDHRVVEFALGLPLDLKIRDGRTKYILRRVLERYVPSQLFDRPKMGFGIPLDKWLRGPLKEWASDLLSPSRLEREGYLRPGPITLKWQEHLSGKRNWQHLLWAVLMFQAWLEAETRSDARTSSERGSPSLAAV